MGRMCILSLQEKTPQSRQILFRATRNAIMTLLVNLLSNSFAFGRWKLWTTNGKKQNAAVPVFSKTIPANTHWDWRFDWGTQRLLEWQKEMPCKSSANEVVL
jgi:hypothetical protein